MQPLKPGAKSRQCIDVGLPANVNTTSIVEVGDHFFLAVSGNVIYAMHRKSGC
jgi:hypothetical protein